MSNQNSPITLPPLVEGATLAMPEPRPSADAGFVTKKGRPVEWVCTAHQIVETGKGTAAIRLHGVVVAGVDDVDRDVKGQNVTTDKYLSPNAVPYTMETLALMGISPKDEKGQPLSLRDSKGEINLAYVEAVVGLVAAGDVGASGLGRKVMRVSLKTDSFNGADVIRVADISQPPQKLEAGEAKTKLVGGIMAGLRAGKAAKDASGGSSAGSSGGSKGGGSGERNPSSPPPGVKSDEPIPF